MPQYNVEVEFSSKKTIKVFSRNEELAEEYAEKIVSQWPDVSEVTETNCLEEAS